MTITKQQSVRAGESGNVLFLILIAVALFAALSYAVTQSSRSGGGDANSEKSLVSSSQLTQYPAGVRTAIVRMIVSSGISVEDLLFDDPSNNFVNLTTDALKKRGVFYPTLGGGATYATAPSEIMASGSYGTWIFSSKYQVQNVGITVANNTGNEIIAFLPGVTKSICTKMDQQLGIDITSGIPTGESAVTLADNMDFNHQGIPSGVAATFGSAAAALAGQPFGCFVTGSSPNFVYTYYHVLVER
ncbi:MAG: hypothetical protein JWO78_1145 [Micavibrio sp.]|nr:hypothetical protein [Micavibrio sp.]